MLVAVGSDRSGYMHKQKLISFLEQNHYQVKDCGTLCECICDYPDFATSVAMKIIHQEADFGVLICGTGEGMSIAANKHKGIRCGIGYNDETAQLLRAHNDANIIAFGAKYCTPEDVQRRTLLFLSTGFLGGYHSQRVNQISQLESSSKKSNI